MQNNYYGSLPDTGFIRLSTILKIIPIGKSTWYAGMKAGQFPKPIKIAGKRITAWRVEDIKRLIETGNNQINKINNEDDNGQLRLF